MTRSSPEGAVTHGDPGRTAPAADLILVEGYKTSDLPEVGPGASGCRLTAAGPCRPVAWVSAWPQPTTAGDRSLHTAEIARFTQAQLGCQ